MKLPKAHQDNQNWIKEMVMKNSSVMNGGMNQYEQDNEEEENQEQNSPNRGRNMDGKNNYFNLVEKSNNNNNGKN